MSTANTEFQSLYLRTLTERGFIHQCTDFAGLDAVLAEGEKNGVPVAAYIGFDCTATSLHVGGLMQIMALRWLQKTGHKPVVLMGGGTTRIGDPSFKDSARPILTDDVIATNMAGIKSVFAKYLSFGQGAGDAIMVNNADWLDKLNYIEFLRDYGRLFSVNRMLSMDSVKLRLEREQHLSFLEFDYMILQAYDFVELNRQYGVRLQLGGSDQWGNIINGVELGRRTNYDGNDADYAPDGDHSAGDKAHRLFDLFGLTTPLLTTASGAKMGKSVNGAVWLNADMLSPYELWQYWRNTEDADVIRFLKLFTELSLEQIAEMATWEGARINEAKKILATEVTALCHGREAADAAAQTAHETFVQGGAGAALPEVTLSENELREGIPAFELFFQAGLAASKGDARRLIRGGGAKVNDVAISDENAVILLDPDAQSLKLSAGKKQHKRILVA